MSSQSVLSCRDMCDQLRSGPMVAKAMPAVRFIDASPKAGIGRKEINAALAQIASHSGISESRITHRNHHVTFTDGKGGSLVSPARSEGCAQGAEFAALLGWAETAIVLGVLEREMDGAPFESVGVSGIDQPRIVQVGGLVAGIGVG